MEILPFGKCFVDVTGGNIKIKQADYLASGLIPIIDQGKAYIGGFTEDTNAIVRCKLPCVIYGDHSRNIKYSEQPFAIGADGVKLLEATKKIIPKYGYYFLQTVKLPETGYDRSFKFLKRIKIPVPDLETQTKIITILDKSIAILGKREQIIARYDELLRAIFLDMFGDPVINPKSISQVLLSNKKYFKIQGGGTPSKSKAEYYSNEIPWVTPKDMKFDLIDDSKIKISTLGLNNSSAKLIKPFSTVVVVRSGILKHTLPVGINVKEITINQDLKAITPLITKPFFTFWNIKLFEKFLLEKVRAVTADNIDSDVLFSISLLNPDMDRQIKFEKIAETFYNSKKKALQSKLKIEALVDALSQLAFNGQLKFNTAVDLEILLENDYIFFKENSNIQSIQLLLERLDKDELNKNKFYESETYDKAKGFVFELLKEEKVKQVFDEKYNRVKLSVS